MSGEFYTIHEQLNDDGGYRNDYFDQDGDYLGSYTIAPNKEPTYEPWYPGKDSDKPKPKKSYEDCVKSAIKDIGGSAVGSLACIAFGRECAAGVIVYCAYKPIVGVSLSCEAQIVKTPGCPISFETPRA